MSGPATTKACCRSGCQVRGLPSYAGTFVVNLIATDLGMAATFTHLLLWNHDDLRGAWSYKQWKNSTWNNVKWKFWNDDGIREHPMGNEDIDPHDAQMLKYPDAPNSWYYATFMVSFVVALVGSRNKIISSV
ncbi:hypothetical protein EV363DRAFT_963011 [Boletus edulis]|nr:hypothetical protein EV363DRAFT_963011 [Boletus edulis]